MSIELPVILYSPPDCNKSELTPISEQFGEICQSFLVFPKFINSLTFGKAIDAVVTDGVFDCVKVKGDTVCKTVYFGNAKRFC